MTVVPSEPQLVGIRAGAGAGKTTRITRRYVNHIVQDGLSPLQIVAVTFTDAAAMELRSRIREKLGEVLDRDDDRLAELEAARISTFHSLAAAICRQHPVEAGVPADFALLDEVQGALWLADKLDDALDALPTKLFSRIPFTQMRSSIRALMSDPISAELALKRRCRDTRVAIETASDDVRNNLLCTEAWIECRAIVLNNFGDPIDGLEPHRANAAKVIRILEENSNRREAIELAATIKLQSGQKANWSIPVAEMKEALKEIRDSVKAAAATGLLDSQYTKTDVAMLKQISHLRRAYRQTQERLARVKRQERLLDYSDLEVHALRALESEYLRRYYHDRWKAFVVDEYQDTNQVQTEILRRLRTDDSRRAIVGDANQSIYGFRRADPGIIDKEVDEITNSAGIAEQLDTNYRTHSSLVGDLNTVFDSMFADSPQDFLAQLAVRDAPSGVSDERWLQVYTVGEETPESSARRVSKHPGSVGKKYTPPRAQQLRLEARRVAEILNAMQGSALIHDRESGCERPLEFKDVAIIARTWSSMDAYGDALSGLGVPSVHMGGGNLMDTREARDGYILLRFLADRSDNLALAAVLKSPFFSLSDLDLYRLRNSEADSLYDALLAHQGDVRFDAVREILGNLIAERNSASPSRLLHILERDTGITAVLQALPSGARRLADWRGFCALVRDIEKTSFDTFTVSRVLRRLDMARNSRSMRVDAPRLALEAGNAVSLMTIHRSKGLEWPVVVMADLGRKPKLDDSRVLFDPEFGVAIKDDAAESAQQPVLFRFLKQRIATREREEEKRLLYVAATRARDCLILASTAPSPSSSIARLLPALEKANITPEIWPFDEELAQPPAPALRTPVIVEPELCLDAVSARPTIIPATSLTVYEKCPRRFKFRYVEGHPGIDEDASGAVEADENQQTETVPSPASPPDAARRVGDLTHLAIQYNIDTPGALQRHDRTLESHLVARALHKARVFRNAPEYVQFRVDGVVHEQPIQFQIGDITITGRIDLLGPDFVVDFKTGRRGSESDHLLQLWLYAQATQRDVIAICYLDGMGPTVMRTSDLSGIREDVESIVGGIESSNFNAAPEVTKCARCPYNRICPESATKE